MESSCNTKSQKTDFKTFIKSPRFYKPFFAVLAGGALGFAYYYFVGCQSGSCPMTSTPYGSILTGGLLGFLVTNSPCQSC